MIKSIFNSIRDSYRRRKILEHPKVRDKTYLLPFDNPSFKISKEYFLVLEFFESGSEIRGIYRDSSNSLTLYNGNENADALIGFDINFNEIHINQLQARLGIKDLPQKWERILLESAINFAKEISCEKVYIQEAKRIKWYLCPSGGGRYIDIQKHRERLKMRYDITAKRRGFTLDEKLCEWRLDLK